jgi:NarL family two-component system response regulator LiaR
MMEQDKIKVLIIDDSTAWIKFITLLLDSEDDMIVVGSAKNYTEGLNLLKFLKPDIVILDLYFSGMEPEGLVWIQEIKSVSTAKIIVTTSSENPVHVEKALLSGAKDFVVKENFRKLPETIREVLKRWSTAEVMTKMVENYEKLLIEKKKDDLFEHFQLTAREKEVLKYLEDDLNRSQIAKLMFTTENTVKNHITNLLKKLEVSNTKEAVEKIKKRMMEL